MSYNRQPKSDERKAIEAVMCRATAAKPLSTRQITDLAGAQYSERAQRIICNIVASGDGVQPAAGAGRIGPVRMGPADNRSARADQPHDRHIRRARLEAIYRAL